MTMPTPDPFADGGLGGFAERFRRGAISSEVATRAMLDRIETLDGRLGAFQHVAREQAIATARAMDALLAAGTDLGPLMGVPVAIKDLVVVDGMPTGCGTLLDVEDLLEGEGTFIRRLRQAGCVLLGKTKTVEFALGITGASSPCGTPHNPWDAETHRLPGGSSSGSAVAVAAGLCAFAVGSDTGGSVRVPAALCGVFGQKTSVGLWPTDGSLPLAPHLDSLGLLTRSAEDAAIVFAALTGTPRPMPARLDRLRLGRPTSYFFDDLEPEVERATRAAIEGLARTGVRIDPVDVPEAPEREAYFPIVLPACLVATLGPDRVREGLARMDRTVGERAASGLDVKAADYLALEARRRKSVASASGRFEAFDAWISPTTTKLAPPLAALDHSEAALALALGMTRNTQPSNYLDLCACSLPLPGPTSRLPVGLQIMGRSGNDMPLLSIALALEAVFGKPVQPAIDAFAAR